jgi:hypothetical protein
MRAATERAKGGACSARHAQCTDSGKLPCSHSTTFVTLSVHCCCPSRAHRCRVGSGVPASLGHVNHLIPVEGPHCAHRGGALGTNRRNPQQGSMQLRSGVEGHLLRISQHPSRVYAEVSFDLVISVQVSSAVTIWCPKLPHSRPLPFSVVRMFPASSLFSSEPRPARVGVFRSKDPCRRASPARCLRCEDTSGQHFSQT